MGLTVQDQMLIEQRITNDSKSAGVAYLLWFFLGSLGGHRFYLGRVGTGLLMLAMLIVGFATVAVGFGAIVWVILGIWLLVDLFLIPGIIRNDKEKLRQRLTMQALTSSTAAISVASS